MFDHGSIFGGDGFFDRKHADAELSPKEKARRRAARSRLQRALARREDWTPAMRAAERERLRREVAEILEARKDAV